MSDALTLALAILILIALSSAGSWLIEKTLTTKPTAREPSPEKSASPFGAWELVAAAGILTLVAAIAVPNLYHAKMAADEAYTIGALRNLNTALLQYQTTYGTLPKSLNELGPSPSDAPSRKAAGLIDKQLASGTKNGYRFVYQVSDTGEWQQGKNYSILAEPVQTSSRQLRVFRTSDDQRIEAKSLSDSEFKLLF
jgi:type II secretory pathway pseudopilin PulG